MAKRIITISREFGSGGRFIGEEVAKKLGTVFLQYLFFFWKVEYDTEEEQLLDDRRIG